EHAGIENGAVGHALLEGLLADELVDELVGGVVPGVAHHRLAFDGRAEYHTLMTEAAQTGALLRHAVRVKGIDLDHPAEAVGFVAVVLGRIGAGAGGVEADELITTTFGQCPAVAAVVGADSVMGVLPGNVLVTIAEITGPVLLGGHVGVPGCDTHGTVVQGTPGSQALRAVLGLDQIAAAHRAMQLHGGQAGDAAVVFALHQLPAVVGALSDVHHGHAMGRWEERRGGKMCIYRTMMYQSMRC